MAVHAYIFCFVEAISLCDNLHRLLHLHGVVVVSFFDWRPLFITLTLEGKSKQFTIKPHLIVFLVARLAIARRNFATMSPYQH